MFAANWLVEGPHTILLTNLGGGPKGTFFDFDYAVVNTTKKPDSQVITGPSSTLPGLTPPSSTSLSATNLTLTSMPDSGISNGAIAGIVVAVILALGLLGLAVWWLFTRRRRARNQARQVDTPVEDDYDRYVDVVEPFLVNRPDSVRLLSLRQNSGRVTVPSQEPLISFTQPRPQQQRQTSSSIDGLTPIRGSSISETASACPPIPNTTTVATSAETYSQATQTLNPLAIARPIQTLGVALPFPARPVPMSEALVTDANSESTMVSTDGIVDAAFASKFFRSES